MSTSSDLPPEKGSPPGTASDSSSSSPEGSSGGPATGSPSELPSSEPRPALHPEPPRRRGWAWPLTCLGVVAILIFAALFVFQSLRDLPGDAVDKGAEVFQGLAAAFQQGTVEIRFVSYATRARGSNYLQVATLEQTEVFRRTDTSSVLWGRLELPEVVVEATAPVTYTYYLDLEGSWKFEIEGRTVRVLAPQIRFNKPAIDASEIRFETRASSLFRDEDAALAALKGGLSDMARRRARENVQLIRELARNQVEEFVRNWISRSFGEGGDYRVQVVFADETEAARDDPLRLREE